MRIPTPSVVRLHSTLDRCLDAIVAGGHIEASWRAVFDELDFQRATLSPGRWRELATSIREHELFSHAMDEPVTHRSFTKPRGYAGDAVTMDMLYSPDDAASGAPPAASERLSRVLLHQAPAVGVRERRASMARNLTSLQRQRRGARVLSVACGHMREAAAATRSGRGFSRLVGLDQDGESLSEVRRSLAGSPVETVERSVRTLLRGDSDLGEFDLIYSMGLYDYLEERTAMRLTRALFQSLRPGGRLLIANFLPIPMRGYMEAFMDWWLIYRTPVDLARLTGELDSTSIAASSVSSDSAGTIAWLDVRRAG